MANTISVFICLTLTGEFLFGQSGNYWKLRENGLNEIRMGHYSQAETWIRLSLESARANNGEYALALDYATLGDIYQAKQQFTQAEQAYRKASLMLPGQHEQIHARAIVMRNLGAVLTAEGRFDGALVALNEASKLTHKNEFKDLPLNAEILNSLGVVYFNQGQMRRAETSFTEAARVSSVSNNTNDALYVALTNLGSLYQRRRQYKKAEAAYKRSLEVTVTRAGDSHSNLSVILNKLGSLYTATGRHKEAKAQFERSLVILEKAGLSNERLTMQTLHGLAKTYVDEHDEMRAEPLLARAAEIAHRRIVQSPDTAEVIELLEIYSKVLKDLQNPVEAERVQEEARLMRASMVFTVRVSEAR